MTCANSALPLELAWENVTVSSDGRAVARGIALGIGTPQQQIVSLTPSFDPGNTWVFNAADCVDEKDADCIAEKGGVYDKSKSDTFVQSTKAQWNGTAPPSDYDELSFTYFNDDVHLGEAGLLRGLPLLLNQPGKGSQGGLSLGPDSNFLTAVVDAGLAPSKAWSLWGGSRSVVQPVNGALWIGGYDKNRVDGGFTTFKFANDECRSCVIVTKVTYDVNGASKSLFPADRRQLGVSLSPFWHTLRFPADMFDLFVQLINGSTSDTDDSVKRVATTTATTLGSISIEFEDGYTTTIPPQELFAPLRELNKDGVYSIIDNTISVSVVENYTMEEKIAYDWGLPFFTMNYITMDYDQRTFQLAPAVQGPLKRTAAEAFCTGVPPDQTSTDTPANASGPTPTPAPKPNVGAIAGGVVGGVAALVIIGVLIFFVLRGRRKARQLEEERDAAIQGNSTANERTSLYTTTTQTEVSELGQNNHTNQWVHTQTEPVKSHNSYDIAATMNAPFEMPATYR